MAARLAWREGALILFGHGFGSGLGLGLFVQKPPVETLLGTGGFCFQPVEHFLVENHFRALGHGTFLDDVVDAIDDGIGRDFPFGEAAEGFDLFRKAFHRCRQRRALFLEIFVLPVQHIAQQTRRFVIEIVAGGHHVVLLLHGCAVELIPLDGSAG